MPGLQRCSRQASPPTRYFATEAESSARPAAQCRILRWKGNQREEGSGGFLGARGVLRTVRSDRRLLLRRAPAVSSPGITFEYAHFHGGGQVLSMRQTSSLRCSPPPDIHLLLRLIPRTNGHAECWIRESCKCEHAVSGRSVGF